MSIFKNLTNFIKPSPFNSKNNQIDFSEPVRMEFFSNRKSWTLLEYLNYCQNKGLIQEKAKEYLYYSKCLEYLILHAKNEETKKLALDYHTSFKVSNFLFVNSLHD